MTDVMKAENDLDIYVVFEFLDLDLHAVIKANILEEVHKKYIIYQSLKVAPPMARAVGHTLKRRPGPEVPSFRRAPPPRHEAQQHPHQLGMPRQAVRLWPGQIRVVHLQ